MSDEPVTLESLSRQQQRLLDETRTGFRSMREEISSMRDDMTLLSAIVHRLDGTVGPALTELRAMHGQHRRPANRVRRVEDQLGTPE